MKLLSKRLFLNGLFSLSLLSIIACGGGGNSADPDPQPETAKLTKVSLTLDGPKAKLDAVATHQEASGITNQTSTTTVTISAFSEYAGTLALEETTGTAKADATTKYTTTYQITGIDATISGSGDKPTLTTRATGTGTLKITTNKGGTSSSLNSVTFPLTVSN